jgi:hypothetical protein
VSVWWWLTSAGKKNGGRERSFHRSTAFIVRGERERERAWGGPLESVSDTDVVLGQRAIGTHQVPLFPVKLARGAVGLKLTQATVALGRAQFFTPNVFYFPN